MTDDLLRLAEELHREMPYESSCDHIWIHPVLNFGHGDIRDHGAGCMLCGIKLATVARLESL